MIIYEENMRSCYVIVTSNCRTHAGRVTEKRVMLPGRIRSTGCLGYDLYFYLDGLQNDNIKVSLTPGTEKPTGPMLVKCAGRVQ